MDWIDLVQDRDRWRAVVSAGNFVTSCGTVRFSQRLLVRAASNNYTNITLHE
jgi:hypothetical protein